MNQQETDEQFFARLQDQWSKERQAALDALQNHPGPCTCVYHVHFQQREKKFGTLADAFIWSAQRERDELQYTEKYILDDGSELLKTTAQWSIADELESDE